MTTAQPRPAWAARPELRRRAPDVAFAAVLLFTVVVVMLEMRGTSFFADEWDFLLNRPGVSAHTLLTPHGPHLVALPILVYKAVFAVFGGSSYVPFRALAAVDFAALITTVGLVSRRYLGSWWSLAPMILLACLGSGASSILSPFQVVYTLSLLGGVWALVALSSTGRTADVLGCLGLVVSIASCSQGVGFLVGAAVLLLVRREPRRAWVVVLPAVLYAVWYATYGHQAGQSNLALWPDILSFTIGGLGSTIGSVVALTVPVNGLLDPTQGTVLLFAAVAVILVALHRGWRPRAEFWALLATILVLWALTAVSSAPGVPRLDNDPRYLSSNGMLLLLLVATCLPRPRLRRGGVVLAGFALLVIGATNTHQYSVARASLVGAETVTRAETGSLLIMQGVVPPSFSPGYLGDPGVSFPITAGNFFRVYDGHGLVSDSVSQIAHASEATRVIVDGVLQRGEQIGLGAASLAQGRRLAPPTLAPGSGAAVVRGGCRVVPDAPVTFDLVPGVYRVIARRTSVTAAVGRFASAASISLGSLAAGTAGSLLIPADHAPGTPWRLELTGTGGRLCRVSARGLDG